MEDIHNADTAAEDSEFSAEEYYSYDNVDEYLRIRQQPYLDSLEEEIPSDVKDQCDAQQDPLDSNCLSAQANADVGALVDAVTKKLDSRLDGIEAAVNELNAKFSKLVGNGESVQ